MTVDKSVKDMPEKRLTREDINRSKAPDVRPKSEERKGEDKFKKVTKQEVFVLKKEYSAVKVQTKNDPKVRKNKSQEDEGKVRKSLRTDTMQEAKGKKNEASDKSGKVVSKMSSVRSSTLLSTPKSIKPSRVILEEKRVRLGPTKSNEKQKGVEENKNKKHKTEVVEERSKRCKIEKVEKVETEIKSKRSITTANVTKDTVHSRPRRPMKLDVDITKQVRNLFFDIFHCLRHIFNM